MEINHEWSKIYELQVDESGVAICCNALVVSGSHQHPAARSMYQWKSCTDVSLCCVFLVLVTKALGPKQFQLPFRPQDDLLARAMAQGPKTVDVPASLPTPPHNNQEELR